MRNNEYMLWVSGCGAGPGDKSKSFFSSSLVFIAPRLSLRETEPERGRQRRTNAEYSDYAMDLLNIKRTHYIHFKHIQCMKYSCCYLIRTNVWPLWN